MKKNTINYDECFTNIYEMLNFEALIDYKKSHNIELTDKEKFFDLYIIKPSTMLSLMERIIKNGVNNEKR